jgi:tripartite-type tricarboxylate transporter receptor subunit TctC
MVKDASNMMSRSILALAITLGFCTLPAQADAVADFYKGKTITLVSAGEAGGAHGTYAQVITAHIKKHIPGNPTVVVQYMLGAGGNQAANYLYNVAPKDGTVIGLPLQDLIFNARIGVQAVKYDAAKVHYLGGADVTRTTVSVMKASGILTLEDARQKEVLMGSTGKSGQTYIIPMVLNALLGTKFRPVIGYQGINFIHLAMERGELHGSAASWPTIAAAKKSWVEKGLIANLVTVAMEREPELPDVPALSELVTSEADRALIPLLAGSAALGRAWIAFGDVPDDRLAALRDAWTKTMADPAFRADAEQRGLALNPVSWQVQQDLTKQILATPDATVARLKDILGLE